MMSFVGNLEAQIQQKGVYKVPDELEEAYFITKGIAWWEYRTMPAHVKSKVQLLWHLENLQQEYQNKPPKSDKP